jgi:hypothetical protein
MSTQTSVYPAKNKLKKNWKIIFTESLYLVDCSLNTILHRSAIACRFILGQPSTLHHSSDIFV